jgi:hypothetical protein
MYRHYAELPAMRARLEQFSLKLDAHIRAFIERDRVSNLHNGSAILGSRGRQNKTRPEYEVKCAD